MGNKQKTLHVPLPHLGLAYNLKSWVTESIKEREFKLKKAEKRNRPGVRPGNDLKTTMSVADLLAGKDNSQDILHPARFLPSNQSPMEDWFHQEASKHPVDVHLGWIRGWGRLIRFLPTHSWTVTNHNRS